MAGINKILHRDITRKYRYALRISTCCVQTYKCIAGSTQYVFKLTAAVVDILYKQIESNQTQCSGSADSAVSLCTSS